MHLGYTLTVLHEPAVPAQGGGVLLGGLLAPFRRRVHAPAAPVSSAIVRWGYPLLGVVLFLAYAPTLARGATFSDGPEIVTAITTLGVAHPTGYPVFVVLTHFFTRLLAVPLPQVVKVEIFNALCACGAAIFTARSTRAIAAIPRRGALAPHALDADTAGLVAGAFLGASTLLWAQVRIPEVYPFHVLLVTWAGYAWTRFEVTRQDKYIVLAAFPMGVGLAHHVTMVYMLPAAFVYLLVRRPGVFVVWLVWPVARFVRRFKRDFLAGRRLEGAWVFPVACLVGALPLLSYLYLIWANSHTTGLPWGDVSNLSQMYDHMTGRQYRKFMGGADIASRLGRLWKVPDYFDQQFLPTGTALLAAGLISVFRRATRFLLFLLAVMALNVAHGAYYSVGDYANYYLPALFPCAVLIGAGYAGVAGLARNREPATRPWLSLATLFVLAGGTSVALLVYARYTRRLPRWVGAGALPTAIPIGVVAVAALAGAVYLFVHRRRITRVLPASLVPLTIAAFLGIMLVPVAVVRGTELSQQPLIGESYGAELALGIPRGSVLMTQGDGYLFTMWYEHHVLDRGTDFATVDMGNVRTGWYSRYVRSHNPASCDPLLPASTADPAAYRAKCGTFRQRMDLAEKGTWVSLGTAGARRGTVRELGPPFSDKIVRGGDAKCKDEAWRREHRNECRCFDYTKRNGTLGEDCVYSPEEGGIVPREAVEVVAQRMIEDHLDERPIFERNTITNWIGNIKDNPRGWSGPPYQRISADYALVNRGRYNQVVWFDDIKSLEACGETLHPVRTRALRRPTKVPKLQNRRAYKANTWPTLFHATFLSKSASGRDDDATREFRAGDTVHIKLDWFERWAWSADAADHRGTPILHGLRVCVFDPSGQRVGAATTISGKKDRLELLSSTGSSPRGTYTVQACSVGEIGDRPVPDDLRCERILLEYTFDLQ